MTNSIVIPARNKIGIVGVPMDLGSGRRGVDMGPSAIRYAGLHAGLEELGCQVMDPGNIEVAIAESLNRGSTRHHYLEEIARCNQVLAERVEQYLEHDRIPLVLGGDHSVAIGSISGVSAHWRKRGKKIGLIWIDAHGDFNTPATSPSGNIHGMPFAVILGYGPEELTRIGGFFPKVDASNCVLVGVRSLDLHERILLKESGVRVVTMRDLDERGMSQVMNEAVEIAGKGTAGFHCSMDIDFIDPEDAPGVGTPVDGGGTYRESHLAMEKIADSGKLLSLDLVEINPILDTRNHTAQLGLELILSAFGKRIF
jgi:arginase